MFDQVFKVGSALEVTPNYHVFHLCSVFQVGPEAPSEQRANEGAYRC